MQLKYKGQINTKIDKKKIKKGNLLLSPKVTCLKPKYNAPNKGAPKTLNKTTKK
jgi:hypothetical protein